jgi:hypothetical protein
MHLVVHQVVQLEHMHVADRGRTLERLALRPSNRFACVRVAVRPLALAMSSG